MPRNTKPSDFGTQLTASVIVLGLTLWLTLTLAPLKDPTPMRNAKVTDLDIVRKEVFGDVGDEPNVYSDYDRCCELECMMVDASVLAYCDNATLLEIQKLLNGTKWTPDTLESIATILNGADYKVEEPQDED